MKKFYNFFDGQICDLNYTLLVEGETCPELRGGYLESSFVPLMATIHIFTDVVLMHFVKGAGGSI